MMIPPLSKDWVSASHTSAPPLEAIETMQRVIISKSVNRRCGMVIMGIMIGIAISCRFEMNLPVI